MLGLCAAWPELCCRDPHMNHPEPSAPLLSVRHVSKRYGDRVALQDASFDLWPGEVLAVVGESGSGKSTLLNAIAARSAPDEGTVQFRQRSGELQDIYAMTEAQQRLLARTDWGFVHQNAADGLRMDVSAGANVGERLMGLGERHYGKLRATATECSTVMVMRRLAGARGLFGSSRSLAAKPTTRPSLASGMPADTSSRREALARSADSSQLL